MNTLKITRSLSFEENSRLGGRFVLIYHRHFGQFFDSFSIDWEHLLWNEARLVEFDDEEG